MDDTNKIEEGGVYANQIRLRTYSDAFLVDFRYCDEKGGSVVASVLMQPETAFYLFEALNRGMRHWLNENRPEMKDENIPLGFNTLAAV